MYKAKYNVHSNIQMHEFMRIRYMYFLHLWAAKTYNQATTKVVFHSNETSKDNLSTI